MRDFALSFVSIFSIVNPFSVIGLILAAIAVEFIASGLGEFFPAWTVSG